MYSHRWRFFKIKMEREEPPPMSENVEANKKDIFGDNDDDDDLFKSVKETPSEQVEQSVGGGSSSLDKVNLNDEDTSGYVTSEVNRSNTLDDIEDGELFKSAIEPSATFERVNGAAFSNDKTQSDEEENGEKEIPLDDDDDDQYEEEKLKVFENLDCILKQFFPKTSLFSVIRNVIGNFKPGLIHFDPSMKKFRLITGLKNDF